MVVGEEGEAVGECPAFGVVDDACLGGGGVALAGDVLELEGLDEALALDGEDFDGAGLLEGFFRDGVCGLCVGELYGGLCGGFFFWCDGGAGGEGEGGGCGEDGEWCFLHDDGIGEFG